MIVMPISPLKRMIFVLDSSNNFRATLSMSPKEYLTLIVIYLGFKTTNGIKTSSNEIPPC